MLRGKFAVCDDVLVMDTPYTNAGSEPGTPGSAAYRSGIPNLNSKYREDCVVRVHMTPFEERVERCDDEFVPLLDFHDFDLPSLAHLVLFRHVRFVTETSEIVFVDMYC